MKRDRVAIGITGDEEAAEGTVGQLAEDRAAPLDNEVVQCVGVIACDPERHARTERPGFGKRTNRLSQRQRDRRGLENDGTGRTLRRGFEPKDIHVELADSRYSWLQWREAGSVRSAETYPL